MRILVTRPLEDVGPLVAALQARGHEAVVEPMLSIERRADVVLPLPLDGVQALLFTSANGVRAFADLAAARDLPVFAVGEASAAAARAAGFSTVDSADGDVADLARLVRARLDPGKGALFHPAASQLAGDLQGALEDAGFTLRRAVLYEAQPAVEVSPALRRALTAGDLDAAIFFSPRTARTFAGLVERAGLAAACARLQAICLSEAVAARLEALPWARVLVAARPEQDAVLARLDEAAAEAGPHAPESAGHAADGLRAPDVIAAFGGIRPMASKLGVAVSTVQGWRERGSIPAARHAQIQATAESHGIPLDPATLAASDRGGDVASGSPAEAPVAASAVTAALAAPKAAPASPPGTHTRPDAAAAAASKASARPATSTARLLGAFVLGVIAVAAGAGLAIVGRDVWLAELPATGPRAADGAAIASLEARLATMEGEARNRSGDAGTGASAVAPAALAQVEAEISALRSRLDDVAKDVAAAGPPGAAAAAQTAALREVRTQVQAQIVEQNQAISERIDALDATLGKLQGQLEGVAIARADSGAQAAGGAALALAVLQLRDAVQGSAPFAAELQTVRDLARLPAVADGSDLDAALTPLIPYAERGVPALAKLKAEFPAVARAIVGQGEVVGDEDWLAGIKRRASGLISIRPVGPVAGASPAAIAARAEAALAEDDLTAAVRELSALQAPVAAAADAWLTAAEARLAVHAALMQLNRSAIARLDPGRE